MFLPRGSLGSVTVNLPVRSVPLAIVLVPRLITTVPVGTTLSPTALTVIVPRARAPTLVASGKLSVTAEAALTNTEPVPVEGSNCEPSAGVNSAVYVCLPGV